MSAKFKEIFLTDDQKYLLPIVIQENIKNKEKFLSYIQKIHNNSTKFTYKSAFENRTLAGEEIVRFREIYKNHLLSSKVSKAFYNFETVFEILKIRLFTGHFTPYSKRKRFFGDTIITYHKVDLFVRKSMPYFFDGP
jgi:hypothetical protein